MQKLRLNPVKWILKLNVKDASQKIASVKLRLEIT